VATELEDVPESWPVESSEDLYRSSLPFAFRADVVRRPGAVDEEPFTRVVLEHPGAVFVLAFDQDQRVLCLQQYRHPVRRRLLELPAGLLDVKEESPLAAAKRELREEAGLEATDWQMLSVLYTSPGISDETAHFFVARGLLNVGRGNFVLTAEEADMNLLWVPFDELRRAVRDGRVRSAPLAVAVMLATARTEP
jgi:ADP-ribose pyrophosphatase